MYSVYVYEALLILCKVHLSNGFDLDPCEFCALTPGYTSSPMHMPKRSLRRVSEIALFNWPFLMMRLFFSDRFTR